MTALLALWMASSAQALDDPGLYFRQQVGFGGWPTGLMSDTRIQYRTPLTRKEGSLMLNDTYAGAGMMARVSPAFSEVGPRVSVSPVDVFSLDLQASRVQYYSKTYGLMGFSQASGKLGSERVERAENGDGVAAGGWSVTAAPTVKIKLGPIVAFDSWTVQYFAIDQAAQTEFTYEPWRDQVIAWNDVAFDHEAAVLLTAVDSDDGGPTFWLGGWARDRWSLEGPDRSTTVGPAIVTRPGRGKYVPNVLGRAMFYATDGDRVGTAPNLQCALIWAFDGDA